VFTVINYLHVLVVLYCILQERQDAYWGIMPFDVRMSIKSRLRRTIVCAESAAMPHAVEVGLPAPPVAACVAASRWILQAARSCRCSGLLVTSGGVRPVVGFEVVDA
jgi:hypothetical protein